MDIYEVIRERRSIRKFKDEPVNDEVIKKLLDTARLAPSWSNRQCWQFIIVKDNDRKDHISRALPEENPARKAVAGSPVVVVVCADPSDSGIHEGKEYYLLDAGLAMEHLVLSAHAEGLGTCWVAWFEEQVVKEACRIPENYRVVALTPLGVPEKQPSPRPRKELDQMVHGEFWQGNYM